FEPSDLAALYDRMAGEIEATLAGSNPVLLCVMLGGLVPTAEIARRLNFAFELDYLHATRYRGETEGGELVWKVSPGVNVAHREVLVIDDIIDEGKTLAAILAGIDAQGANRVRTAILLSKQHDRRDPALAPDFLGAAVPDRYVFGAGMDYKGYFRQLPAVYAVRE
ncbi:MAG: hypoxanthine-guanine phosphoribosyltransferase, partial [Salinisphaera sp.]|nr:hypoxanthine-guanine phosphoribosyltransferase [Salinisphaera sp.]